MGYADFLQVPKANRPDGAGTLTGRVDVTSDTQIDLGARYTLTTQRPGSPELPAGTAGVTVTNQPIIFSSGVTLGATQRFNRLELSLKGTFDRTVNQNATQSDGTIIDLAANNFNAYGVTGRAAYEISPKLKPFVEATVDMRRYDQRLDQNGFERSSNGLSGRGGSDVPGDQPDYRGSVGGIRRTQVPGSPPIESHRAAGRRFADLYADPADESHVARHDKL